MEKEIENNCGIYCWTNILNGKKYIGQGINLKKRKNDFLNFNLDYSGDLINKARNKYNNPDYWDYSILKYCQEEELNSYEEFFISIYESNNNIYGYNLTIGGDGVRGYKLTEKTRNKMKGRTPWNKGVPMTKEQKDKLRKANIGKHLTEEHKRKLREANKDFKHTEETIKKISKSKSKPIFQIDLTTNEIIKEWVNSIEAASYLKIQRRNINKCCNGERKSCGGFGWIFKKVS